MWGTMHRSILVLLAFAACGDNLNGNTPPTVGNLNLTTDEDVEITRTLDVDDAQGDTLTITLGTPANGTVAMIGNSFTYTPNANFNGTDQFSVTVDDGALTAMGVVSIAITPVNDVPIGGADSFATNEDVAHAAEITSLLSNDSDVDGDTLTIVGVGNNISGTAVISGDDVIFTPLTNFTGVGSYRYTLSDGKTSTEVTVSITIGGVNDPPNAVN